MSAQIFTPEELNQYATNGYILVPELVSGATVAAAAEALWAAMELSPDRPAAWPGTITAQTADHPALLACYTPQLLRRVVQLTGAAPTELTRPETAFAINSFPLKISGRWKWPKPHIDNSGKSAQRKIFPPPHRMVTLIYLSDVEPRGGGTVVWPHSHQLLQAKAGDHTYLWQINQLLDQLPLGDPVEMTPRRGDVLFYHRFLVHAGSANTTSQPRLALHHKW